MKIDSSLLGKQIRIVSNGHAIDTKITDVETGAELTDAIKIRSINITAGDVVTVDIEAIHAELDMIAEVRAVKVS